MAPYCYPTQLPDAKNACRFENPKTKVAAPDSSRYASGFLSIFIRYLTMGRAPRAVPPEAILHYGSRDWPTDVTSACRGGAPPTT